MKSPVSVKVTLTVTGTFGAGAAVSVKLVLSPSVTSPPAVTVISGTTASLSATSTVADAAAPTL